MEKMTAPYIDHKGAVSDEEAMTIQTTIDNFRNLGFNTAAEVLDHAAAKRVRLYGAGDVVPIQPVLKELYRARA